MPESPMSTTYRAMIYAAVATMHFYRKDIVDINPGEVYGVFHEKNQKVMRRVLEELLNLFNYQLSSEQLGKAIKAYLHESQSVDERPAATLRE